MTRRIILAGGSGFLGQLLAPDLSAKNWEPIVLTRRPSPVAGFREVAWDARSLGPWVDALDGAVAVINLTGRSVNCRYTAENKQAILGSRVDSTRVIGEAIARCSNPPRAWLNASTATIYRHTFGAAHDETSTDFAAEPAVNDEFSVQVAQQWERALNEASAPLTRKVALRISIVFGTAPGGVFRILRRLAKVGLGGPMGGGRQFVSWIHEEDFCRAVEWILDRPEITGPINIAAPHPLTNAEMMKAFRSICGIPPGLPAARWMLEIGAFVLRTETELLLKSRRVVPGRLLASGFEFRFASMPLALKELEQRLRDPA